MTTRRKFLLGAAAVSGGVAVGFRLRLPEPLTDSIDVAPGQTALTPYVVIDQSGVTIITPRAEMGQGIHTTLAALVAEELDVPFDAITVAHGPASEHYSNTIFYGPPPYPGRTHGEPTQATGGQTSIRDGFVKMRQAGAAARLMLMKAASEHLGCALSALTTHQGAVIDPRGNALAYSDLAITAGTISPPEDPPLKPESQWSLLGTSLPRVDMPAKCTGTARYAIDVPLPDLLYATVRRNPRLGGEMRGFDASRASEQRGLKQIIPMHNGVIVVATNTWYAFQAADLIAFDWGPAPYPDTGVEHQQTVERAFSGGYYYRPRDQGDVKRALGDAPSLIEGEYHVPYLAHATMEPLNATALLHEDQLDIWVGNQFPTLAVLVGAQLTGLPKAAVRVHTPYMGGGFGRRFEMDDVEAAVRAAMAVPGRAVRVTYSREEDMSHDTYRPMAMARFRAAVAGDRPVALDLKLSAPSLFVSGNLRRHKLTGEPRKDVPDMDISISMGAWEQPYHIDHYRVTAYRPPELLPVGWLRSVGESQNCFFHESIIDEIALAANQDPLSLRLSLLQHAPSRQVLEAVAEMSGWGSKLPEGHARGVAYALSSGAATAQVIEISHIDGNIKLHRAFVAADVGTALDPLNIAGQLEGALNFGLSLAIYGEITVSDGTVDQTNFHDYPLLRMHQAPGIQVRIFESGEGIFGVGEAATPTTAPALGNAIFAATGTRLRELPFNSTFHFV